MGSTDENTRSNASRAADLQSGNAFGVYVAASAAPGDAKRVAAAIAMLRAHGFRVTCTWPEVVARTPGGANPRDASIGDRRDWSTQDLNEVDEADAVWFLVPSPPATTRGAWFEAGYAYANLKHVVFSGDTLQSVFCALGTEAATDEAAIRYLRAVRDRELAKRGDFGFDLGGEAG